MIKERGLQERAAPDSCSCCAAGDEALLAPPKDEQHNDYGEHRTGIGFILNKKYAPVVFTLVLLLSGMLMDGYWGLAFFRGYVKTGWYIAAYLPVGLPVLGKGLRAITGGNIFTEFLLMSIATLGAFAIGQFPEGVAVMLFYAIGELSQQSAVSKAKNNIKALLDLRPTSATVLRDNRYMTVHPENVEIGEVLQVKAGEKVPLDGEMLGDANSFNTSALTGESKPRTIYKGGTVLAGMLNLDSVAELKVTRKFTDSSLARILEMVQLATSKKAKPELMIRKFAKIYTPIVFFAAVALIFLPYFFLNNYVFSEWLYRGLIFLVISCPCALVISIPLGYFGGIGAASRHGILFKGSGYLDLMTKINTFVFDKTGTLTHGVFKIQEVNSVDEIDKKEFIKIVAALESTSTHPIAKAITAYADNITDGFVATGVEEIPGYGLRGMVNGCKILAGNTKLLTKCGVNYPAGLDGIPESVVAVAIENDFAGYMVIADEIKEDALKTIAWLHHHGARQTVLLSGDKGALTQQVASRLNIVNAFGDLLPEDKVAKVEELKQDKTKTVEFVGDGINDAPVLALSDIGIAMGALGSDAAIETADVVIQTDHLSRIVTAIKISRVTRQIVIQNIVLAFAVKLTVLILGAGGLATMWEAVFADVGVALVAIMNAVRILKMRFSIG